MNNLRIIFMGTPEFAVASLGALLINEFNIVGVVTSPDKPAGRGRKITKSAVKEYAESNNLYILQPHSLKDPGFINNLKGLKADLFVVVAFRMLPEVVWKMPARGTVNLHASLLPHYRGAAPVSHVIINGETSTGLTTFFINDKIDTGNILLREEVSIFPTENAGDLGNRLMKLGARLLVRTIKGISAGNLTPLPQSSFLKPGEIPKEAPKIFPQNCIINWKDEPVKIHNLIRGLAPDPGARSTFIKKERRTLIKIFESFPELSDDDLEPGYIVSDGRNYLKIACKKGFLNILTLQSEGKKVMGIQNFLRGFNIEGCVIEIS
jgi:methionyl-tRNA formyltransferase